MTSRNQPYKINLGLTLKVKNIKDSDPEDCSFCHRQLCPILCHSCGHVFQGRVRTPCPDHPGVIHLMDSNCCPNCQAPQLKELRVK